MPKLTLYIYIEKLPEKEKKKPGKYYISWYGIGMRLLNLI